MQKHLYYCGVNDLKDIVEGLDFQQALNTAQEFFRAGGLSAVEEWLAECGKMCAFDDEFDLYLLIGLGQVDGTSLPGKKPFLYFGLERYSSMEHLRYVAAHEYNHMVRIWSVYQGDMDGLSFGELVIMEGLAVVFSSLVTGDDGPDQVESALFMTEEDLRYCTEHREALMAEVLGHWQEPMGKALMSQYMTGSYQWKNERPTRIGYFVGAEMVRVMLAKGMDIGALTRMPAGEMMEHFHAAQAG